MNRKYFFFDIDGTLAVGTPGDQYIPESTQYTLKQLDAPIMIERDNNIPPLLELQSEYNQMKDIVQRVRNAN